MVFYWRLSDSKSIELSRILLSIQADLKSAVVWMVLILPLISCSSRLFSKPLGTVPTAPTTIGITATFMFYDCFVCLFFLLIWLGSSIFSVFCFRLFSLCSLQERQSSVDDKFFSFSESTQGLIVRPGFGDLLVFQNHRELFASLYLEQILVCVYIIWWGGPMLISSPTLGGSPFPRSHD